jgi:hypothetical protein
LSVRDQDALVEVCVALHLRYEDFSVKLVEGLEKSYHEASGDFTRRRNILRLMSELYLRGLLAEYKKIFKCLNQMTLVLPPCLSSSAGNGQQQQPVDVENPSSGGSLEEFQNALLVLTDYLKTYGEVFFWVLPKQRREAIENDHEVALAEEDRHEFLNAKQRHNVHAYLLKHLAEKCLPELNARFRVLKQLQGRHTDNLKEVREDERIEREFAAAGQEFARLLACVGDFADVLDADKATFNPGKFTLVEEKITNKMIIKKTNANVGGTGTNLT